MAEALISRLGELAIKAETTKGTKNAPAVDGTESLFRVYDLDWTLEPRMFERRTAAKTLSRYAHLVGQQVGVITGKVELRQSAVTDGVGAEDAWYLLLKAAGLAVATGGSANTVTFTSDQSAHTTLTAFCWIGSNGASGAIRRGIRGAVARACKLDCKVGEPSILSFELVGAYDSADAVAPVLGEISDTLNTIAHEDAIPGVFNAISNVQLDDSNADLFLSSFSVDFGPQAVERQSAAATNGIAHYVVADRDVTIELDPEVAQPSAAYWAGKLSAGTEVKLELTHTQPATSSPSHGAATFAFVFPKCQVQSTKRADRNGIETLGVTLKPDLSAEPGDDEMTLTITKAS